MATMRCIALVCLLLATTALASRGTLQDSLGLAEAHPSIGAPSTTCSMCTLVIDRVKAGLNDTAVQATILDKLLQVCSNLPADLVTECSDLVRQYGPRFLARAGASGSGRLQHQQKPVLCQFIEAADSRHLCTLLGVCSDGAANSEAAAQHMLRQRNLLSSVLARLQGQSNDACDVCKMTVIEAHSLVSNPSVQASLVNYTKSLCAALGDVYTKACQDYIDVYAPALFELLEKFLASDELCVDLGICPSSLAETLIGQVSRFRAAVKVRSTSMLHNIQQGLGGKW